MQKLLLTLMLLTFNLFGNDGVYTLSGNQLIPIKESKISIKKEVLTITRIEDNHLDVRVEYTLFNPDESKEILVGFEAAEPEGDVQSEPVRVGHPYMQKFSVLINNQKVTYEIKRGKDNDGYVYYFKAKFQKAINHITHHYKYETSSSLSTHYEIDYILSAASRWANGVIEDFTLIINVGEYERLSIEKTFFKKASEWNFDGMSVDVPSNEYFKKGAIRFYVNKGSLIFKKRNFRPTEELSLLSLRGVTFYVEVFNYRVNKLPFKVDAIYLESSFPKDKMSYKILKNLPYARRGYVFKDLVIQKYYEGLEWYRKNPNYKSSRTDWTEGEKEIDEQINKTSLKILRNLPYAKRGYVFKDYDIKLYTKSYKKDPSYKANFSSLPLVEQQWIKKIKAMKKSDNIDFYALVDAFEKIHF